MASNELQTFLAQAEALRAAMGAPASVATMKERTAGAPVAPVPEGALVEEVIAGSQPAEWVSAPGAAADVAVLFLHGGGYALGRIADRRDFGYRLSAESGARVLNLDYRLAPEHQFPAAVDDTIDAYRWLLGLGLAPERIIVGGDSAGGGLAFALLLAIKRDGLPMPRAAFGLSPWTDLAMTGESIEGRAATDSLSKPLLVMLAEAYAPKAAWQDSLVSPLYGDLAGLPPLMIQVGTREILYDDSARFASRAIAADVPVTFEPWPDVPHVWPTIPGIPESIEATRRVAAFIRRELERKEFS